MNYKIKIPDGCKVMNVEVTNNRIILEVEKEEPEFKENDIVYTEYVNHPCISIINFFESYSFCSIKTKYSFDVDLNTLYCDSTYAYETIRLATDSEKQLLFDKLKEKCLMFDGKDVVRWRAEPDNIYYCVDSDGVMNDEESCDVLDDIRYKNGNYFPTYKMAESFKKQYIESLNNFHKNL